MKAIQRFARALAAAGFAIAVIARTSLAAGPVDDLRASQLEQEVRELKQQLQQQERRIETLEAALRTARSSLTPVSSPAGHLNAPVDLNQAWLKNSNWDKLRPGMSDADAIGILGPPTTLRKSDQGTTQTLFYARELEGGGFLSGHIVTAEHRVLEIHKPELK